MMDLYLKLLRLVEIAIRYDFYDQKRQILSKVILASHHSLHLWVVYSELLLADFVYFFCELFDKEV